MRTNRLQRLLEAEILDAQDDIRDLERTLKTRIEAREITNYVFRENTALLEQELHALERIRALLKEIDPTDYSGVDEYGDAVMNRVREFVRHHDAPGAVVPIISRRLKRITDFLKSPS